MHQDQCPSTKGKQSPDTSKRDLPTTNGRQIWRSAEEFGDAPEFRDFLEREFPAGASELATENRRDFMKLMGAGLALAGAATIPGCRRPDHKIYSYSRDVPEQVVPGKPLWYATSMPLPGGGAEGLLIETHESRPTKVEGNPLHPINQGKSSTWSQASVLEMYSPDRLRRPRFGNPARGYLDATWDDFAAWGADHFAQHEADGGARLAFIVDKKTSPTRDAMRERVRARFPRAAWVSYDPVQNDAAVEGSTIAFGRPMREVLKTERAKVVLGFDRSLLEHEAQSLPASRGIAANRYVNKADQDISRIYAVEHAFTLLGGMADHRLRAAPSEVTRYAYAIGAAVLDRLGDSSARGLSDALGAMDVAGDNLQFDTDFVDAVADDLVEHRGEGLIVVGASQPAAVHAMVHVLNSVLGNVGRSVSYLPMSQEHASSSLAGLRTLVSRIRSGGVETVVTVGVNPVFDAPADTGFAEAFAQVQDTIAWDVQPTETVAAASRWQLNGTHYLESWGDTEAADGTIAPTQPMIAPLYQPAWSELELLAFCAGVERPSGFDLVRETWQAVTGLRGERFEAAWRRALHDGVLANVTPRAIAASVDADAAARAIVAGGVSAAPAPGTLEVVYRTGHVYDGRFADNGWLQELPATGTRVVWDNPVVISPKTAEALGLEPEAGSEDPYTKRQLPRSRMARLSIGDRDIEVPVWIVPGMADNVAEVTLGYGRQVAGAVGTGVGFNTYAVRTSDAPVVARGATLARVRGSHEIVSTQNHWSLEGRHSIYRQIDKKYWDKYAAKKPKGKPDKIYGAIDEWEKDPKTLNVAEQMGELAHTPSNIGIYKNPMNRSRVDADPEALEYNKALNRDTPPDFAQRAQWGMTIDQSTCTGCGVCTIACQSENNIPVVGKREVAKGREMTWIRVDRYFVGDDINEPEQMVHQPIACVHCENAPCEVVCPVNATVHGPEGTNDMVYNRCIGTRYCSNNCPYKVRRFNFFDYAQAKFNGGWVGEDDLGGARPKNINLIPPRLREQVNEIQKMRMNPDVTVRSRGVMEKCTYCIQRVNRARYETKLQDLENIPDGFIQTACQQACPSGAIVFGDILDESAKVTKEREQQRSYLLLGYLNVRPRTSHLLRVNNPNPRLRASHDPMHHGGGHGGEHEGEHHGEAHGEHAFFEPHKKHEDDGYAMSLRVLGQGAHA